MSKLLTRTAMLIVLFGLASCSSNQPRPIEFIEDLATNIHANDSKFFLYSLTMVMPDREQGDRNRPEGGSKPRGGGGMGGGMGGSRGGNRGGMQGGSKPDKETMMQRKQEKITAKLEQQLASSGYCREGYIVLESTINRNQSTIRGECNEGASDEDRLNFPNNSTL